MKILLNILNLIRMSIVLRKKQMCYHKLIITLFILFFLGPGVGFCKISNLTFAGGGVLGVSYIGVLEAIEEKSQPITDIKRFAGTSVGSIVATMAAVGYTPKEMKKIIMEVNFSQLLDQKIPSIGSENIFSKQGLDIVTVFKLILNKRERFGLNSGDFLANWVDELINAKIGKRNATFRDLQKNNKELYVVASDLSRRKTKYFSFRHTPDVIISQAVKASTSVPILFDLTNIGGDFFADGGIYDKYPIFMFDGEFEESLGVNFVPHDFVNKLNLGLSKDRFSWEDYFFSLVTATFTAQNLNEDNYPISTITLSTLGVSPADFHLTNKKKEALIKEGYDSTVKYLQTHDPI